MVIPDGYSQINLFFTGAMVPLGAEVVFGVNHDNVLTPTEVATVVSAAITSSDIQDRFSNQQSVTTIRCKQGPNDDGPFADLATAHPGQSSGDMMSQQVALLLKKSTNRGGRKGVGRMFWPGILASDVLDTGRIGSTAATAWTTQFGNFVTALDTADCTMVLLHGDDTTPDVVTALTPQSLVATQKRRLRRR